MKSVQPVRVALIAMSVMVAVAVWSLLSYPSLIAFVVICIACLIAMFWDHLQDFWESQEFFDE